MEKNKNTKRALIGSVLSLVLCFAMLIGSTFAWFTDSVVSGTNKIVAGNLDVELVHTSASATEETVKDATDLFVDKDGNPIKWEPGVMTYENFTVKNAGNLALKFYMNVKGTNANKVIEADGSETDKTLKDVLKVAFFDSHIENPTRETIKNATLTTTFEDFNKDAISLAVGAEKKYAMVIYWEPTATDNEYNIQNGKKVTDPRDGEQKLYIDLGVTLKATQDTVENDSFDNTYDTNAWTDLPKE